MKSFTISSFRKMKTSYESFESELKDFYGKKTPFLNSFEDSWQGASAKKYHSGMKWFMYEGDFNQLVNMIEAIEGALDWGIKGIEKVVEQSHRVDESVGADSSNTIDCVETDVDKLEGFLDQVETAKGLNESIKDALNQIVDSISDCVSLSDEKQKIELTHSKVLKIENFKYEIVEYIHRMNSLDRQLSEEFNQLKPNIYLPHLPQSNRDFEKYIANLNTLDKNKMTIQEYYCAILNTAMYIDPFDDIGDYKYTELSPKFKLKLENGDATLKELVDELSKIKEFQENDYMTIVKDAMEMHPELGNFKIVVCSRLMKDENGKNLYNEGTNGIVFQDPITSAIYVTFRGTSDGEWSDDAARLAVTSLNDMTIQMQQVVDFINRTGDKMGWTEKDLLYVTGHSQGGNDAQVTILCSEKYGALFDKCYSMDGEGHSPELLKFLKNKYGEEKYNELLAKMYAINGHDDPIHEFGSVVISGEHSKAIGNELGDNINDVANGLVNDFIYTLLVLIVAGIKGDDLKINPVNAHDIKGMFGVSKNGKITYSGNINEIDTSKSISVNVAKSIWAKLNELPADQRISCQVSLLGIVEAVYGRKYTVGINGETFTKEDLKVLKEVGIPLIIDALYDNLPEENQKDREKLKQNIDDALDALIKGEKIAVGTVKNIEYYTKKLIEFNLEVNKNVYPILPMYGMENNYGK